MKIQKSQLKAIIKECLVEILAEGIGQDAINEAKAAPRKRRASPAKRPPSSLNEERKPTAQLHAAVSEVAGGDSVMQSILADTAQTTLQEQLAGEGPGGSPGAGQHQVAEDLSEAFGIESTGDDGRWANLAFNDQSSSSPSMVPPPPPGPQKLSDDFLDQPVTSNK
jgi:hypothetical protein